MPLLLGLDQWWRESSMTFAAGSNPASLLTGRSRSAITQTIALTGMKKTFDRVTIGIDLGGSKIAAALVDPETGGILSEVFTIGHGGKFLEALYVLVDRLLAMPGFNVSAVGIGCAGAVDASSGKVIKSNNLKLENFPLAAIVARRVGLSCRLANDVEAASLAEARFGAGRGSDNHITVLVGTGVGSRLVANGTIWQGAWGVAGELGQSPVLPSFEPAGTYRALEYWCSRPGIERLVRVKLLSRRGDSRFPEGYAGLKELLSSDPSLVVEAIDQAAELLGQSLAGLVCFLNPERIIIGGGVVEELPGFFEAAEQAARKLSPDFAGRQLVILRAMPAIKSGVIGAALLPYQ